MILFRLDANEKIATGHMYRCISIAQECIKRGEKCLFLVAKNGLTEPLIKAQMPFEELDLNPDNWNEGTDVLIERIKNFGSNVLVVDSYNVTPEFFDKMSAHTKVFYLDDLCKRKYNVEATLHYSEFEGENVAGELYAGTNVKVYTGTQYVPLRREFSGNCEKSDRKYDILITTGGSDTYHITKILLDLIASDDKFANVQICAVLGKLNGDADEIKADCSHLGNISIMQNISNMGEVMHDCKYAVTAAGITVYELMASGVVFNVFAFSDDQVYLGERLDARHIGSYSGDARENPLSVACGIKENLLSMINESEEERISKVRENLRIVDGKGSERIADILVSMCNGD